MDRAFWIGVETYTASDYEKCPIVELRDKLILLLMIDGMARASDVATLSRKVEWINRSKRLLEEDEKAGRPDHTPGQAKLFYYNTKEQKTPRVSEVMFTEYKENPRLCTVVCLDAYIMRTVHLTDKVEKVKRKVWEGGKQVEKEVIPLLLSDYPKKETGKYFGLGAERIAKLAKRGLKYGRVDTNIYKAHSIRGASSSKLVNLCGEISIVTSVARWAKTDTFKKHYWRQCIYRETNPELRLLPICNLLRMHVTVVDPSHNVLERDIRADGSSGWKHSEAPAKKK